MPKSFPKKLLLASPRGFCAGVKRAIDALNEVKKLYPQQTIYCYHQIVHNTYVVEEFEKKGVCFVDNLDQIPPQSVVVFSAHGVSPQIKKAASLKRLKLIDATCPFVEKTHYEVKRFAQEGFMIIYLGKAGHDEAVGTTGEAPNQTIIIQSLDQIEFLQFTPGQKIALVTQTTLSLDETQEIRQALKKKFPSLIEPAKADICLATQNRQNGVKEVVKQGAEVVVVLGSPNSSNSRNLQKTAKDLGVMSYLVDDVSQLHPKDFLGKKCVGLTAGASLPENRIQQAIKWFIKNGSTNIKKVITSNESDTPLAPVRVPH